jgi:hypothetical protein
MFDLRTDTQFDPDIGAIMENSRIFERLLTTAFPHKSPYQITSEHLHTAWCRFDDRDREIFRRRILADVVRWPSRKQLGLELGLSASSVLNIENHLLPYLAIEIWAAVTGFTGLPRPLIIHLRRHGCTRPADLPRDINHLLCLTSFGRPKFDCIEAWLAQYHPRIDLRSELKQASRKKLEKAR